MLKRLIKLSVSFVKLVSAKMSILPDAKVQRDYFPQSNPSDEPFKTAFCALFISKITNFSHD